MPSVNSQKRGGTVPFASQLLLLVTPEACLTSSNKLRNPAERDRALRRPTHDPFFVYSLRHIPLRTATPCVTGAGVAEYQLVMDSSVFWLDYGGLCILPIINHLAKTDMY